MFPQVFVPVAYAGLWRGPGVGGGGQVGTDMKSPYQQFHCELQSAVCEVPGRVLSSSGAGVGHFPELNVSLVPW